MRKLGSDRSRRRSVIGSGPMRSFSRLGQKRQRSDSRPHCSDAFDKGAALWGRRLGVPVSVLLVRYLHRKSAPDFDGFQQVVVP